MVQDALGVGGVDRVVDLMGYQVCVAASFQEGKAVDEFGVLESEDEQSILLETSSSNLLFSEPPLLQKRFYAWLYLQVYYSHL